MLKVVDLKVIQRKYEGNFRKKFNKNYGKQRKREFREDLQNKRKVDT